MINARRTEIQKCIHTKRLKIYKHTTKETRETVLKFILAGLEAQLHL